MMISKKHIYTILVIIVVGFGVSIGVFFDRDISEEIVDFVQVGREARIYPDYSSIVIPTNIVSMNFTVREDGEFYCVRIGSSKGNEIEVFSRTGKILIDESKWSSLLKQNKGEILFIDVFCKDKDGKWLRYDAIRNTIAREEIDGYLVYRKIHPGYRTWHDIGIYQRELGSYAESVVLDNSYFKGGCLNCHTFCNNKTDKMLIGLRSAKYGSSELIVNNGEVNKIGTKFGYTSWHPSGKIAVYSLNKVYQLFHHSRKDEYRDVIDIDSALAYYDVESVKVKRCEHLSKKDRLETYPAWSSNGKYLYYCSAPIKWSTSAIEEISQEMVKGVKYDLMRISYDVKQDNWGEPEVVVSAEESGKSSLEPRVSPDGRWLLFCMCEYSCFPVYQPSSDLYMIDLGSRRANGKFVYRKLNMNSEMSESWHSWSSNSRWIAFSSKRMHGSFTRTYFSYIDVNGIASKPFVLPQKDPGYYEGCLRTFSMPELVVEPVRTTKETLGKVVRGKVDKIVDIPISSATIKNEEWQERE
jgi:hypothetical protein